MSGYAPKCERTGNAPYVVTTTSWGTSAHRIEYAANLTEAKQQHGWTRQLHTRKSVRRARLIDMPAVPFGWCECCHPNGVVAS